MVNSCDIEFSCFDVKGYGEINELIGRCNDPDQFGFGQCENEEGLDIINTGCVSYM